MKHYFILVLATLWLGLSSFEVAPPLQTVLSEHNFSSTAPPIEPSIKKWWHKKTDKKAKAEPKGRTTWADVVVLVAIYSSLLLLLIVPLLQRFHFGLPYRGLLIFLLLVVMIIFSIAMKGSCKNELAFFTSFFYILGLVAFWFGIGFVIQTLMLSLSIILLYALAAFLVSAILLWLFYRIYKKRPDQFECQ
jgi:uncharacterized membrane protein